MATFTVTTLVDEDNGAGTGAGLSLREAVKLANTFAGPDRIEFSAAVGGKGSVGEDHRGVGAVDLPAKVYSNIVHIEPGESFADAMAGQPAGTLYIVGQGVHREQQVIPRHGDAFIGEPGAVMNGAYEIPRSTWSSGHFKIDLSRIHDIDLSSQTPVKDQIIHFGDYEGHVPESIRGYPEQLFVTTSYGRTIPIQREEPGEPDREGPREARWSLDYDTGLVSLRNFDQLQVAKVELATKKFAFGYNAEEFAGAYGRDRSLEQPLPDSPADMPNIYDPNDPNYDKPRDVVIQNLIIEKYANPAQTAAIGYFRPGLDWLVENNEVRWNNGVGIKFRGDDAIVRDNDVHHNGQFGISAGDGENAAARDNYGNLEEWGFYGGYAGNGGLVQNNEIAHNRLAEIGIDSSWGAGGTKFMQAFNLQVLNNCVHDNNGRGLWSDTSYAGTLYQGNHVYSNGGEGIFIEGSLGPTRVIDNATFGNGKAAEEFSVHGAQIAVMSSPLVEVSGNFVMTHSDAERGNGIVVTNGDMNGWDAPRHTDGIAVQGFGSYIHDNTILIDGSSENGHAISEGSSRWTGGQSGIATKDFFYLPSANRFADNDYYLRVSDTDGAWRQAQPDDHGFWRWSPPEFGAGYPAFLDFSDWQALGQDAPGAKTLVHNGSSASDEIVGGADDDSIYLGAGGDIGKGGAGRDFIAGEGGEDVLSGGADRDVLSGGAGNDILEGEGDRDYLLGDNGDDILAGGPGWDVLDGGLGFDIADYSASPKGVTLLLSHTDQYGVGGADGTKTKQASLLGGDAEGDSFVGIEGVIGSKHNDLVYGFDAIKGYLDSGRTGLLVESRKGTWADLGDGDDIFDNDDRPAFFDTTPGNTGGEYRNDDADIEICRDGEQAGVTRAVTEYNVGYIDAGEYLSYPLYAAKRVGQQDINDYTVSVRVASKFAQGKFSIELCGSDPKNPESLTRIPLWGEFEPTGDWQNAWTDVKVRTDKGEETVQLVADTYYDLKLTALSAGFNINYVRLGLTVDDNNDGEPDKQTVDKNGDGQPDKDESGDIIEEIIEVAKIRIQAEDYRPDAVDTIFGGAGDDRIWTGAGNDELYGGPDNDFLSGEAGDDTLRGDGGEDSLYGGAGADILYGGADRDQFIIEDSAHSRPSLRDHVQDLELGVDRINLSAIDANVLLPGNQAFAFIGTRPFSALLLPATPGQVRVSERGGETLVQWNTDFDRDAEGEVLVNDGALTAAAWSAAAFVL